MKGSRVTIEALLLPRGLTKASNLGYSHWWEFFTFPSLWHFAGISLRGSSRTPPLSLSLEEDFIDVVRNEIWNKHKMCVRAKLQWGLRKTAVCARATQVRKKKSQVNIDTERECKTSNSVLRNYIIIIHVRALIEDMHIYGWGKGRNIEETLKNHTRENRESFGLVLTAKSALWSLDRVQEWRTATATSLWTRKKKQRKKEERSKDDAGLRSYSDIFIIVIIK